jgi:hypothetical protein
MTIKGDGNVGIGQTAPASSVGFAPCLELRGEPSLRFEESGTSKGYEWCMNSSNDFIRLIGDTYWASATKEIVKFDSAGDATFGGNVLPSADNSKDLGAAVGGRWANLYTADIHLNNEGTEGNEIDGTTGDWNIQEGEDDLYLLNRKSGKKYRFKLEEIE